MIASVIPLDRPLLLAIALMHQMQYSIRQLLVAVTVIATSIVLLRLAAQYDPSILIFGIVVLFSIGMLGLGIVVFAGLLALSIYADHDQAGRRENLGRCSNLAGIGFAMMAPFLIAIFVVPFLLRSQFQF